MTRQTRDQWIMLALLVLTAILARPARGASCFDTCIAQGGTFIECRQRCG